MRHWHYLFFMMMGGFFVAVHAAKLVKRVSVYYEENLVNNTHFAYRLDVIDGIIKESWYVDDQLVSQKDFENTLDRAESEERAEKRAKKREHRLRVHRLQERALRMQAQEKLANIIKNSEKILGKLTHYDVEQYYAFSPSTIESKAALTKVRYEYIPAAQLLADSQEASLKEVQEFLELLKNFPEKLNEFFYATIDNAIACCSDTQLLKKLLTLVPELDVGTV